jgi:hypothetical protein
VKRGENRSAVQPVWSMCLLVSILLVACATSPNVPVEEQVGNRALKWANALIALDYDEALLFMTPGYRNGPRADGFMGEFGGAGYWQSAELKWVKCDEKNSLAARPDDASAAGNDADSGATAGETVARDGADDCVVNVWNDCGKKFAVPISQASTAVSSSDRCEVRLILVVMKPPEMSMAMPIPYDMTWLNIEGDWYRYRQ